MADRPPIPYITNNHADYSRHGYWVKHRDTGEEGRVGCSLIEEGRISVCWEGGGIGWCEPEDLLPVDRPPEPWYQAEDLIRLRTNGRVEDIWWVRETE